MRTTREPGPGLSSTGNRVLLAVLVGWVGWFATQTIAVGLILGVVIYLLATLVSRR